MECKFACAYLDLAARILVKFSPNVTTVEKTPAQFLSSMGVPPPISSKFRFYCIVTIKKSSFGDPENMGGQHSYTI